MRTHLTRAAEGFDRRSFAATEILRMRDAGIDAARRVTFVHQGPQGERWRSVAERGPDEALIIAALPDFSVRLATI